MIGSRFTKAFQLIALVLAFSVVQVYVMAGPIKSTTDPRTTDAAAGQPKAETAENSGGKVTTTESLLPTPEAAAEKMALRIGSKSVLTHLFSKSDVEARLAASRTFLKAQTSLAESFKAPRRAQTSTTTGTSDNSDNGRRSTWIAVGVIGAVLAVAIIGLRHDRSNSNQ